MTVPENRQPAPARKRPAGARAPQDHKPKAAPGPKVTRLPDDAGYVVIHKGVSVQITAEALNDYELLEDLASEDDTRMPSILRRLVGDDYDAVKDACRDPKTGRVPLAGDGSIAEWISAVFGAINPS